MRRYLLWGVLIAVLKTIELRTGNRDYGRAARFWARIFAITFAIGAGLVVLTAIMAFVIFQARRPTLLDVQVMLFLGGSGVWCLVLAFRTTTMGPR